MILQPDWCLKNGDSVLLLNYRGDRAVQMCKMFEAGAYIDKKLYAEIENCVFAGALQYDAELGIPKQYLCPPPEIKNTLTEWLCAHNVRQYTVAEGVKFGHVTYFFNGNRSAPIDENLETWNRIPSDQHLGTAFNLAPEMKAEQVTDHAIAAIECGRYDFIKLNLANPDMVGHTADLAATKIACKVVDECLWRLIDICKRKDVNVIILSDHGNAEEMLDKNGKPRSSHTNNLVPCVIIQGTGNKEQGIGNGKYGLTNVAATVCKLLGVPICKTFNASIIP